MRKIGITLSILLVLGVVLFVLFAPEFADAPTLPPAQTYEEVLEENNEVEVEQEQEVAVSVSEEPAEVVEVVKEEQDVEETHESSALGEVEEVVESVNLAVPFTSQAPHANWDMPYQEACEEASVIMVDAFYRGVREGEMDKDEVDAVLLEMVAFEETQLGFTPDMTAEETVAFITAGFGYEAEVLENPTGEALKDHMRAGRPVIVPAAGQQLGNPYFTPPGPVYHMLVLRGFTKTQFITNDPGTRRGEAYLYDIDTIMTAMHDWNGGDVEHGNKVAIIIYP